MSWPHQQPTRLPPIGLEALNEEPQPLKKKKKKRASKLLKHVTLAQSGFTGSRQIEGRPLDRIGERHEYSPHQEVVDGRPPILRHNRLHDEKTSEYRKAKRFTFSQFDQNQPEFLKHVMSSTNATALNQERREKLRKLYTAEESRRIDYVLVHSVDESKQNDGAKKKKQRARFEKLLEDQGFDVERETIGNQVYVKLHCPFSRLCMEAEKVKLQCPLVNMDIDNDDEEDCCNSCHAYFRTDDEVDFVSAPFEQEKLDLYENHANPNTFFRSSVRSLLTDHLLRNLDMRELPKTPEYYYHNDDNDPEEDILSKQGLPYLIMKKVYTDAFILHDESADNLKESAEYENNDGNRPVSASVHAVLDVYGDARHSMNITWPKLCKYQPLWKIRNYFGEEFALYFAWVGLFISSLSVPMVVGLGVFAYGLFLSITSQYFDEDDIAVVTNISSNATTQGALTGVVDEALTLLQVIKEAFDNEATPFYAILICVWGTVFLELWKRKNAVLAYEWDVDDFDDIEPDKPEYFGTEQRKDPITQEPISYYPMKYRAWKYLISFITFLFMVCIVLIIMVGVIVYRVVMEVDYCSAWKAENRSGVWCLLVATVCSTLLNAIAIVILGKVYERVAYKLTDWENHRTASQYKNALIIKLFAFQFANCYSSLYYIAFFRSNFGTIFVPDSTSNNTGILGLESQYVDSCSSGTDDKGCMPMLSFQVLVLMLIKPFPKLLKDVIIPFLKKLIRKMFKKKGAVDPSDDSGVKKDSKSQFLEQEKNKPALQDFTLGEYTEKVIQFGFVMLFAAAMPLAPLVAFCADLFDKNVDAKRLLWLYRRPVAHIAQDIGMWHNILQFLNIAGVITNAFIIAYVSSFGKALFPSNYDKLWAVLVFEHLVFGIKFALDLFIPDVPQRIRIAMRKEKHTVAKILERGVFVKDLTGKRKDLSGHSRMTPEGARKPDASESRPLTSRSVKVEQKSLRRRRNTADEVDGYSGDSENSPRREQTTTDGPAEPQPSQGQGVLNLSYGPEGDSYVNTQEN